MFLIEAAQLVQHIAVPNITSPFARNSKPKPSFKIFRAVRKNVIALISVVSVMLMAAAFCILHFILTRQQIVAHLGVNRSLNKI